MGIWNETEWKENVLFIWLSIGYTNWLLRGFRNGICVIKLTASLLDIFPLKREIMVIWMIAADEYFPCHLFPTTQLEKFVISTLGSNNSISVEWKMLTNSVGSEARTCKCLSFWYPSDFIFWLWEKEEMLAFKTFSDVLNKCMF